MIALSIIPGSRYPISRPILTVEVYGTTNLRTVDASVIHLPAQISTHPQTIVYGIGEKAAEIIVAAHRGERGCPPAPTNESVKGRYWWAHLDD
jgi:choline dehydrogenase-like flavoprotein